MNTYAYRIYRNTPNNPIIGGTMTAENMDSAAKKILERNSIKIDHVGYDELMYHYFTMDGQKVGILIYLNPEEY